MSMFSIPNTDTKAVRLNLKGKKLKPPSIIFTMDALRWMKALVEVHSEEVGWLGLVSEEVVDNESSYVVHKIAYPKHFAMTGSTCEIDEQDALMKLLDIPESDADRDELARRHNIQDYFEERLITYCQEKGVDLRKAREDILVTQHPDSEAVQKATRIWGHSHHTMGTSPSGQDDAQGENRSKAKGGIFIRVICNKSNHMNVTVYDYEQDIRFDNVAWKYRRDEFAAGIDEELDKDVEALSKILLKTYTQKYTEELIDGYKKKFYAEKKDEKYEAIKAEVVRLKALNAPTVSTNTNPLSMGVKIYTPTYQDPFYGGAERGFTETVGDANSWEFERNNCLLVDAFENTALKDLVKSKDKKTKVFMNGVHEDIGSGNITIEKLLKQRKVV